MSLLWRQTGLGIAAAQQYGARRIRVRPDSVPSPGKAFQSGCVAVPRRAKVLPSIQIEVESILPFTRRNLTGLTPEAHLIDSWESDSGQPMTDDTILGDSLAVLSLRVATEVDRELKGKAADPRVFSEFTKELSRAYGLDTTGESAFLHSDPMTTEVFAQAIREASHEPVLDVSSLSAAVKKIIDPLTRTGAAHREHLGLIKSFCLSLHKSMMAQRLPPLHEGERAFEDDLRFVR